MRNFVPIFGSFVVFAFLMQNVASIPTSSSNGGSEDENLSEQGEFCEECMTELLSKVSGPSGIDVEKLLSLDLSDLESLVAGILQVLSGNGLNGATFENLKDIDSYQLKTIITTVFQVASKLLGPLAVDVEDLNCLVPEQLESVVLGFLQVYGGQGLSGIDLESLQAIDPQGTKALVVDLVQVLSKIFGLTSVNISKISEIPGEQIKALLLAVIQCVGGVGFQGIDVDQLMAIDPELFKEGVTAVVQILSILTGVDEIDFDVINSIEADQFMTLVIAALKVLGDENGLKGLDLQELRNIDGNQIAEVVASLLEILAVTTGLEGYDFEEIIKAFKPKNFKTIAVGLLQTIGDILGPEGLKGTNLEKLEGVDGKLVKTFLIGFLKLLSKTEGITDIDFDKIEKITPKQFKTVLFVILQILGGEPVTESEIDVLKTIDADSLKAFGAAIIEILRGRGPEKTVVLIVVNALSPELLKGFVVGIAEAFSRVGFGAELIGILNSIPKILSFLGGFFNNDNGESTQTCSCA